MAAPRSFAASGAGDSLPRLATALATTPFLSPSFAGRSNRIVSTLALTRWAAICAPMTPAPSTATLRIRSCDIGGLRETESKRMKPVAPAPRRRAGEADSGRAQSRGGETDQVLGGLVAVRFLRRAGRALDHAEVGHGVGQRPGDEIQAPVQ